MKSKLIQQLIGPETLFTKPTSRFKALANTRRGGGVAVAPKPSFLLVSLELLETAQLQIGD